MHASVIPSSLHSVIDVRHVSLTFERFGTDDTDIVTILFLSCG
jgi:hypothetical protein